MASMVGSGQGQASGRLFSNRPHTGAPYPTRSCKFFLSVTRACTDALDRLYHQFPSLQSVPITSLPSHPPILFTLNPDTVTLARALVGCCRMLSGAVGCCRVLSGAVGCCRVLSGCRVVGLSGLTMTTMTARDNGRAWSQVCCCRVCCCMTA